MKKGAKKILAWILMILSVCLILIGASFIFLYVRDAVILHLGEPDQSLLFWYLPILFTGVVGVPGGIALFVYAFKLWKCD